MAIGPPHRLMGSDAPLHQQACQVASLSVLGCHVPKLPFTARGRRHVVPTLKNEPHLASSRLQVRVQDEVTGPLGPPPHVFFCDYQGTTVVGNLETGEVIGLEGVGADIWRAIVKHGNRERALDVLLSAYEVESAVLEPDLYTFLDDLFARGLLDDNSRPRG